MPFQFLTVSSRRPADTGGGGAKKPTVNAAFELIAPVGENSRLFRADFRAGGNSRSEGPSNAEMDRE